MRFRLICVLAVPGLGADVVANDATRSSGKWEYGDDGNEYDYYGDVQK